MAQLDDARSVVRAAAACGPPGEESHAVIAGGGHPFAGAKGIRLHDLLGQAWILPPPGRVPPDRLATVFLQSADACDRE